MSDIKPKDIYEFISFNAYLKMSSSFAGKKLKEWVNIREVAEALVQESVYYFKFLPKKYKSDKLFVLNLMKKINITNNKSNILKYCSKELKDDIDIVKEAVFFDPISFKFASKNLKKNKDLFLEAVKSGLETIKFIDKKLKDDIDVVKEIIKNSPWNIKFLSKKLRENEDMMLFALSREHLNSNPCYVFISDKLKNDKNFIKKALSVNATYVYEYINEEFKNDEDLCFEALKFNTHLLFDFPQSIQKNKNFIKKAVFYYPMVLEIVDKEVQSKELYLLGLKAYKAKFSPVLTVIDELFHDNLNEELQLILKKDMNIEDAIEILEKTIKVKKNYTKINFLCNKVEEKHKINKI